MRAVISLFIFTLTFSLEAWAHPGHGNEPFMIRFEEFLSTGFKVRPLPDTEPTAYVLYPGNRKVYLDSDLRDAARRMVGEMADVPESEELYRNVTWREWTKYRADSALAAVNHLFSRRFVLEVVGAGVRAFYREGFLPAALIMGGEFIEHVVVQPLAPYLPLCKVIWGTCGMMSRETREAFRFADPRGLKPLGLRDRIKLLTKSWRLRTRTRRAMKRVYRTSDGVELNKRARNRSYRDLAAGSEAIYGGWFGAKFFRNTLADPIPCEECGDEHGAGMRFGAGVVPRVRAMRPFAERVDLLEVNVPEIADLTSLTPEIRSLKTEEYLDFISLILDHAVLAASDLTRSREDGSPGARKVPLKVTAARAPGFLALNRDISRMANAFDAYATGLRMRVFQQGPRSMQAMMIDREFARSFGQVLQHFRQELRAIDAGETVPRDELAPMTVVPKRFADRVKAWVRSPAFCDGLLTAGMLESEERRTARETREAAGPAADDGLMGLFGKF